VGVARAVRSGRPLGPSARAVRVSRSNRGSEMLLGLRRRMWLIGVNVGLVAAGSAAVAVGVAGSGTSTGRVTPGEVAPAGASSSVATDVQSAALVTGTFGWALTRHRLVASNDGGIAWTSILPSSVSASGIISVYFLDSNNGWFVTGPQSGSGATDYRVYRTTNAGTSWTVLGSVTPTPSWQPFGPTYITFVSATQGWMVIKGVTGAPFDAGVLYRTTDGGSTWSQVSIPLGEPVYFCSSQLGWVAGGPKGQSLYRTTDGGSTWSQQTLSVPASEAGAQHAVHLPTQTSKGLILPVTFEAAGGGSGALVLYSSTDQGATWSEAQSVALPGAAIGVGVGPDGTVLVAINGSGKVVRVDPSGTVSQPSSSGVPPGANLAPVSVADAVDMWAVASSGSCTGFKTGCSSQTVLVGTSDGGYSWSALKAQ
jgi:photosystem II stability/assembly factor-like uncharacterized protein